MMTQRGLTCSTIDGSGNTLNLAKCAVSLGYIQPSAPSNSFVAVLYAEPVGPEDTNHSAESSNVCAARAPAYIPVYLKELCPLAIRPKQVAPPAQVDGPLRCTESGKGKRALAI